MMVNPLNGVGIPDWVWDFLALQVTFVVVFALIRVTIQLQRRERISPSVAQNAFQIFGGPLFIACWLLYSGVFFSRYMAAIVPAFLIIYLIMIVLFDWQDEGFVRTMAPNGEKYNLLKGPFFYLVTMLFAVFYLWYVPLDLNGIPQYTLFIPTGFLIFGPLAGGSGMANIINDEYAKYTFTVFSKKSVEGSLTMFVLSIISTFALIGIYWLILEPVYASINIGMLIMPICIASIVATITKILSPRYIDIILIPLAVFISIFILSLAGYYPYFVVFPFRSPF